jgi:putative ABC transport system permease protein
VPGEWKVIPKIKAKMRGSNSEENDMFLIGADDQFLKTFEVSLIKGRNFSTSPADSSAVMINETAANMLGIKDPLEQIIEIPSVDFNGNVSNLGQPFIARVVGITKDFNFRSLREKGSAACGSIS